MKIEAPGGGVTLDREGAHWKMKTDGGSVDADADNVEHTLENLADIELLETLVKDSRNDATLGLTPGDATHVVVTANADRLLGLWIGRAGARGTAVRLGSGGDVRVAAGLQRVPLFYLRSRGSERDRHVHGVDFDAVSRFERIETDRGQTPLVGSPATTGAWRATLDAAAPLRGPPRSGGRRISPCACSVTFFRVKTFAGETGSPTGLGRVAIDVIRLRRA